MIAGRTHRRAGLTLVELSIVLALLGILAFKIWLVMSSASETAARQTADTYVEDQARVVMDRLVMAVRGSDRESLNPFDTPLYTTNLRYRISLGVDENGQVVWNDPEEVLLDPNGRQVAWRVNPDVPEERKVVWTNLVRPFLGGELPNATDDNGNGLTDEEGLIFIIEGNSVLIRLTLSRQGDNGEASSFTMESRVTCRN